MSWYQCYFALLAISAQAWAQSSESGASEGQFTFSTGVEGSSSRLGNVIRFDASAGYLFNSRWSVDFGIPYYFVSPSNSTTAATGSTSGNGLGNVYSRIRFTSIHTAVNYVSTLTGTAPTGDKTLGLSTGHATADWSNYFDHSFGRLTPFGEIGFANAVSDTMFFIRPYTTSGFVTHVQGGARFKLSRWMSVGGSGYAILPAGQQTVVSRVVNSHRNAGITAGTSKAPLAGNVGQGNSQKPVFETTTVTTVSPGLTRDEGLSTWLLFGSGRGFNLQGGYTRSTAFDLNTIFFGAGFNLRKPVGSIGF